MWSLDQHPGVGEVLMWRRNRRPFLPRHPPDVVMSQGLTEKVLSSSPTAMKHALSTELSSRVKGLCHPELLPKGSTDQLTSNLWVREHQPFVLPIRKFCFPSWLQNKGDQTRAAATADLIWMLGKPETLPRDTYRGA